MSLPFPLKILATLLLAHQVQLTGENPSNFFIVRMGELKANLSNLLSPGTMVLILIFVLESAEGLLKLPVFRLHSRSIKLESPQIGLKHE